MEQNILSIIIQGGAVGLCLASLWIIYKITNGQRQSFISALDRNSEALMKFAEAMGELTGAKKKAKK